MGKPRKKKSLHSSVDESTRAESSSHILVFQRGRVGRLINDLIMDLRKVMAPFTARKLKALKNNVLKDFIQIAGPYGVSHFMLLSKTEMTANLRICRLPRGPTISFHILSYSLCRDVAASLKSATCTPQHFLHPPLLVLSNFDTELSHMKLIVTTLQNMFPSINVQTVKLSSIKRCVLFQFDEESNTILFRHFAIKVLPVGTSRSVKKLMKKGVPNLAKYEDISDFVTRDIVMSESEAEDVPADDEDMVTLPQDLPGAGNQRRHQSAVQLTELGPRMSLQLIKVEDGVCDGEVLHHEFVTKSKEEIQHMKKIHRQKKSLKERRKKEQEANIKKKRHLKEEQKLKSIAGQKRKAVVFKEGTGVNVKKPKRDAPKTTPVRHQHVADPKRRKQFTRRKHNHTE